MEQTIKKAIEHFYRLTGSAIDVTGTGIAAMLIGHYVMQVTTQTPLSIFSTLYGGVAMFASSYILFTLLGKNLPLLRAAPPALVTTTIFTLTLVSPIYSTIPNLVHIFLGVFLFLGSSAIAALLPSEPIFSPPQLLKITLRIALTGLILVAMALLLLAFLVFMIGISNPGGYL